MERTLSLVLEQDKAQELPTKVCPVCGEVLFADLDVCYGCLHSFVRRPNARALGFPPTLFSKPDTQRPSIAEAGPLDEPEPLPLNQLRQRVAGEVEPPLEVSTELLEPEVGGACYLRLHTTEADANVEVGPHGLLVGRASTADVVLHSRSVSRRHLLVRQAADGLTIEDQGATNPALVQGVPLEGSAMLTPGQTFEVCSTRFSVRRHAAGNTGAGAIA